MTSFPLRIIRSLYLDLSYGGRFLSGTIKTRFPETGAFDTGNSDYGELPILFGDLIGEHDVIVDVGCGKGRVLNWLLSCGRHNKMIGIELDPDIAAACRHRLRKFRNITIVPGSVLEHIPDDGTIFYLCNPFREGVMAGFSEGLKESFRRNERPITIVYYNSWLSHMFSDDPCWNVSKISGKLRHQSVVIRLNTDRLRRGSA